MKKFLVAFDGLRFSESTMNYAIELSENCDAHLVGVFLEDVLRHSYSVAEVKEYSGANFEKYMQALDHRDQKARQRSIEVFEAACRAKGLSYSIHRDQNAAIRELYHESVYADLLIIGAKETLTKKTESFPTHFIKELLNDAQCPVLVVPPNYKPFNKIVLLYNGEPSSVFAARSFSHLCSSISHFETEVLTVNPPKATLHLPDNKLIKEFIKRHFPAASYVVLKGEPEAAIVQHLKQESKAPLLVLGSYKRNKVSRLFKQSMADLLMEKLRMPLFIAHN